VVGLLPFIKLLQSATLGSMSSTVLIEIPQFALFTVFETNSVKEGMTHDAPGGARLELGRMPIEKRGGLTLDALPIVSLLLSFGGSVAANVFSNWLYEKLKADKATQAMHITKIRINRTEVEITSEAISRAISESIEIESIEIERRE
jgi:hypothetical protein